MVSKGDRSSEVIAAMKNMERCIWQQWVEPGLSGGTIKEETVLIQVGPEALLKLELRQFPCIVAITAGP